MAINNATINDLLSDFEIPTPPPPPSDEAESPQSAPSTPPERPSPPPPSGSPPPNEPSPPPPNSPSPPPPSNDLSPPPSPPSPQSGNPTPQNSSPSQSQSQSLAAPPPPPSQSSPPPPSNSNSNSPSLPSRPPSPPPPLANASVPNLPSPPSISNAPPSKQTGSSHKSNSHSPSKVSPQDSKGQHIGIAFAGVFILALASVALFFVLRRKKKRVKHNSMPPPNGFHSKGDLNYPVENPGVANVPQEGFHGSTPGNNYGNGTFATGVIRHKRTPSGGGQIVFSYDTIAEITNGFSNENVIGQGGFGNVYKASMPDGRLGAVKLLKAGSGQGEREFSAEVDIISRIHHRNLVSLIGYCVAEQQRVLIYEFVPNGNLNQHLHGSGMPVLDWPNRMKIALGAARGLSYLHEGCNPRIIHRDIKSANILLDEAYEAKVSDFGLARLTDDANTHVSTRVMGTFGYMAPEYATSGKLTDRSDVFSFGVVLLELITGRKPVDPTQPVGDESLVEWARPLLLRALETGDFGELVDQRLEGRYIFSEMSRMIDAAAACVRHSARKRPRMVQVAIALDRRDEICDLSNGVKYGHSTIYDSGQYNEDIMRFRRQANGSSSDSDMDMYSTGYSSREFAKVPAGSSSGESEVRAFHSRRSSDDYRF